MLFRSRHLLSAESEEHLRDALAAMDVRVQRRGQGRTKVQTERFSIAHLMSSLPQSYLDFPLTLEHGDRPDFVLCMPTVWVGIEITEAVPENEARATVMRQSGIGPNVHMLRRARPGEPPRSNETLRDEIEGDRSSEPWMGNEPGARVGSGDASLRQH